MDITHYGSQHFLTLIDCGPSRFTLWRPLLRQDSTSIIRQLESVFYKRGPPEEILTDNDTAFHSKPSVSWMNGEPSSDCDVRMYQVATAYWRGANEVSKESPRESSVQSLRPCIGIIQQQRMMYPLQVHRPM